MTEVRRRRIEVALGLVWLLDGALQFQPYMFSKEFMAGILGMANMGLPGVVSRFDYDVSSVLVLHPAAWNALFATLQVLIGAGLVWGRGRIGTLARMASVGWGISVWLIGEGAGAVFMGGTSLLTGAPGAALLYSVVTVAVWPVRPGSTKARIAQRVAVGGWAAAWVGSALLELEGVNHAPGVPAAQVGDGAYGEPGPVAAVLRAASHVLAGSGLAFAVVLALASVAAGIGVLWGPTRRAAVATGVVVAVFVGLVGQDLGGILTGQATDPGTGPLLVLMALTLWPPLARRPQRSPSVRDSRAVFARTATAGG